MLPTPEVWQICEQDDSIAVKGLAPREIDKSTDAVAMFARYVLCRRAALGGICRALVAVSVINATPAWAAPQASNPEIIERSEIYTVDAVRIGALHRQLLRRGAVGFDGRAHAGLTQATIEARFVLDPSSSGCALVKLKVVLKTTIHLPVWRPAGKPEAGVARYWDDVRQRLQRHEEGHKQRAVAAAHELLARLRALPSMPDCRALNSAAQRVRGRVLMKLQARDSLYDQATDFGRRSPVSQADE